MPETMPKDVEHLFTADIEYQSCFDEFINTPMSDEDREMLEEYARLQRKAWNEISGKIL